MLDATETTLYQQNTSLVRPSTRPRDLKLNKEQRHDKLGHFGNHKNCIYCQQVKQRPRQVYKNPTPVYDHVPGRSIHMDSMYLDVQSRHGDWYCAPSTHGQSGREINQYTHGNSKRNQRLGKIHQHQHRQEGDNDDDERETTTTTLIFVAATQRVA